MAERSKTYTSSSTTGRRWSAGRSTRSRSRRGEDQAAGRRRFRRLTDGAHLPVCTTVNTRNGRINLTAAQNKCGGTASADFFDGLFKLGQTKGRRPITTLTLVEKLACCAVRRRERGGQAQEEAPAVGQR